MKDPNLIAAVGLCGAAGAMIRFLISNAWATSTAGIPWGTLTVNLCGCFLLGALGTWAEQAGTAFSPQLRQAIAAGFLGGLTTFSTFSVESLGLIQQGHGRTALVHLLLHLVGGLAAAATGQWLVRAACDS